MGLLLRTLMIWLLVLALPAQSAAAVTMAFCGPNHHATGHAAAAAQQSSHTGGAHEYEHEHAHEHANAQAGEHAAAADLVPPTALAHNHEHQCGSCASCCSAVAMLGTALQLAPPEATSTVFTAVVASIEAFVAGGPDRPPRSALA